MTARRCVDSFLVSAVLGTVALRDSRCVISDWQPDCAIVVASGGNRGSQWRRVEICSYSVHAL